MKRPSSLAMFVTAGLLVVIALALAGSPLASSQPDGLDKVAEKEGFASTETAHALEEGPVADYELEGVEDDTWSKALSGVVGVLITFAAGIALFAALRARRVHGEQRDGGTT